MTLALLLTVALSLAIGIAAGYYAIVGILHAFSRSRAVAQSSGVDTTKLAVGTSR